TQHQNKEILPIALDAARDKSSNIRAQAFQILNTMRTDTEGLRPALAEMLTDKNKELRASAASSLSRHGKEGMQHLLKALQDKEASVRLQVVYALQNSNPTDEGVIKAFTKLIKEDKDTNVRQAVINAPWRYQAAGVPLYLEAIRHKDDYIRQQGVWAFW